MDLPEVLLGNRRAWWVFQRLQAALVDGMGGVNLAGLEAGLRLLKITPDPGLVQQILILLTESLNARSQDHH